MFKSAVLDLNYLKYNTLHPLLSLYNEFFGLKTKRNFQEKSSDTHGTELFQTLFFLKGDLVDDIPLLLDAKNQIFSKSFYDFANAPTVSEIEQARDSLSTKIIQEIRINAPSFFQDFSTKIQSENYLLIEEALLEGMNQFRLAYLTSDLGIESVIEELMDKNIELNEQDLSSGIDQNLFNLIVEEFHFKTNYEYGGEAKFICVAAVIFVAVIALVAATAIAVAAQTVLTINHEAFFFNSSHSVGDPMNDKTRTLIHQVSQAIRI